MFEVVKVKMASPCDVDPKLNKGKSYFEAGEEFLMWAKDYAGTLAWHEADRPVRIGDVFQLDALPSIEEDATIKGGVETADSVTAQVKKGTKAA
jgi:hypothetical protein